MVFFSKTFVYNALKFSPVHLLRVIYIIKVLIKLDLYIRIFKICLPV